MSLTQTAATYAPSVRGDAMLLTRGRKGTAADLLLAAGAVILDGALGGHIDVGGRRLLGFERRRVVAGPELPEAPPLMAELRERVLAAPPDDPWGWFDRAAGFALERVTEELETAEVTTPLRLSRAPRVFRHDTLLVSPSAEEAALGRLLDALAGRGTPPSIALGALLHPLGLLEELAGSRGPRRLPVSTHAPPAQSIHTVLADQRRREAVLG